MARRPKLLGSETPRLFTEPLRELNEESSLGFACIEFASEVCGIDFYPWQRWLLIHALELAPGLTVSTMGQRGRLDPLFRFRKVIVLVARQNGKSLVSQVLALFFLYILGTDLVLGTAQDLDTAEEVWDGALDIIDETPDLAALADKPILVNGKKTIRLKSGERYKVKAANRRAGRGLSGDLILLDELREHQTWDAYSAITKTTMARSGAIIWAMSNAGDSASVVLRYLRKAAHVGLGDPDGINSSDDPASLLPSAAELDAMPATDDDIDLDPDDFEDDEDTLGLFEWSAPPGCSVRDRDGWALANPSLGYGISERTLAADAKGDPEWVFRTECLCQWSDHALEGPFPTGSWAAGTDARSEPAVDSEIFAAVDLSHDRSKASVAIAGRRADGSVHIEVVAQRAGSEWLAGWFSDPEFPHRKQWQVAAQSRGAPISSLIAELQGVGVNVVEWQGADLLAACGQFYDLVRGSTVGDLTIPGVWHRPDPRIDVAAGTALMRPLGDGWAWDRKRSPVDVAPLMAATGAVWLLLRPQEKPQESVYETRGVLTI